MTDFYYKYRTLFEEPAETPYVEQFRRLGNLITDKPPKPVHFNEKIDLFMQEKIVPGSRLTMPNTKEDTDIYKPVFLNSGKTVLTDVLSNKLKQLDQRLENLDKNINSFGEKPYQPRRNNDYQSSAHLYSDNSNSRLRPASRTNLSIGTESPSVNISAKNILNHVTSNSNSGSNLGSNAPFANDYVSAPAPTLKRRQQVSDFPSEQYPLQNNYTKNNAMEKPPLSFNVNKPPLNPFSQNQFASSNDILSNYIAPSPSKPERIERIATPTDDTSRGKANRRYHKFPLDDFEQLKRKMINLRRNLNPQDELAILKEKTEKFKSVHGRHNKGNVAYTAPSDMKSLKESLEYRILKALDVSRKDRLRQLLKDDGVVQ
jgi:hypothetical protein